VTTHSRQIWATATLAIAVVGLAPVRAQINTTLTDQDRAEIQKMWTTYRSTLFGCRGEEYADEDLYVKTAQGWRIKERVYVPPAKTKP
jgi:hypothetical protein